MKNYIILIYLLCHISIISSNVNASELTNAIKRNNINEIKRLVKLKKGINEKNMKGGVTPLYMAVDRDNLELVKLLVNAGAEIDTSSVLNACEKAKFETFEFLILSGGDINKSDNWGYTPLMSCSRNERKEHVEYLLKLNANLFAQNAYGTTALHYAIWSKNLDMVKLLVDAGSDLSLKADDDGTPLEYAKKLEYSEIIDFLTTAQLNIKKDK